MLSIAVLAAYRIVRLPTTFLIDVTLLMGVTARQEADSYNQHAAAELQRDELDATDGATILHESLADITNESFYNSTSSEISGLPRVPPSEYSSATPSYLENYKFYYSRTGSSLLENSLPARLQVA